MSIGSVAPSLPPLVLGQMLFSKSANQIDLSAIPEFCTHVAALHITVSCKGRDQCDALSAISCCPNLRTLYVNRVGRFPQCTPRENPPLPWPTKLNLPHLRRLRMDPRFSERFTALLLSNCSNIEHLVVASSSPPHIDWEPVHPAGNEDALHRLPYLRTLDIIGDYRALQWCHVEINLRPSNKLLMVSTPFSRVPPMSELLEPRSSCRLEATVQTPTVDPPYAFNDTSDRAF